MSIAGISSNFSAVSSTNVQTEEVQYTEDEQLLTQSLQSETLLNQSLDAEVLPTLAVSNTAGLLNSLQSNLTSGLTELSAATTGENSSILNETATTSASGQNGTSGTSATSNNTSAQSSSSPPGALASLLQEIQASAQQAYTAAQANGLPATGTLNSLGTLLG